MSHEIITAIYITRDDRVVVRHAANNVEPQIFRDEEYEDLTEVLRTEGPERLDEEILYFFFLRAWRISSRYARAVERAIAQEQLNVFEICGRCQDDESFRRQFLQRLATYLKN